MSIRLNRASTVPLLLAVLVALIVPTAVRAGSSALPPGASSPLLASNSSRGSAGSRSGKAFTPTGKKEIDAKNAAKNSGVNKCENCDVQVMPGQKSERGVSPPENQRERDHVIPKSKGGEGVPLNGQILCRKCNREKGNQEP